VAVVTTRAPPRGPAQPRRAAEPGPRQNDPLRPRESLTDRRQPRRDWARDESRDQRQQDGLDDDGTELAGEHEQSEGEEHPDLGDHRHTPVKCDDRLAIGERSVPERQPDEVHGQESRAAERPGPAVCERSGGE
jgi:hypothetical protein